jgi:hypothetical protein
MCDRIKDDDERIYKLSKLPCFEVNKKLENCLKLNDRDFRKCRTQMLDLKNCMDNQNKSFNI